MARENPGWATGGSRVSWPGLGTRSPRPRCGEILHAAGIDPAPRRSGPTWRHFLTAQAHDIIAPDFLVVETVLLQRLYVLVFIELGATEETADIRLATSDGQFDEDV